MNEIFEDKIKESLEKKGIADRNLARVPVSLPAQFMPISEEEFRSLRDMYISVPTRNRSEGNGDVSRGQSNAFDTISEALFERMDRIEEKLDMLLISSGMEGEKTKTSDMEIAQANDLSGSGVRVLSRMALGKGWYLKLSFNLPGAEPYHVMTLSRVIRSGTQNKDGFFESALQFDAICEEDQDRVIAYVFRRQRELAHNRGIEN